ncbi:hypothetical protein [Actinocorallia libanotica]|uniref:YbaB/EbfC DNA-binding family protein n=1 Tax=Actinocorallia libanotica TaxID=46162 RepID=A0ABN1R8M4_9ACTN
MREHEIDWAEMIDEKVRSVNSLVTDREAEFAAAEQAAKADTPVEREIGGGLGKVVLDGRGRLLKVELDTAAARLVGRRRLAERLVFAISGFSETAGNSGG